VYGRGLSHENWGDVQGGEVYLKLDLYAPEGAPGVHPAAIFIHGGGFTSGSRGHLALSRMAVTFASRGWVCISVDYRLAGDRGTVPQAWMRYVDAQPLTSRQREQGLAIYAASRDVKAALRWLTARADELSIDTSSVTALGGSAGAVLAVMLGATESEDFRDEIAAEDDPTLLAANLDAPSDVHSIVDFWGSAIAVELLEEVYGVTRFDSADAPLLIIHGTSDQTVLYEKAVELEGIWTSTGVPFESHALVGAGHAAWNETIDGQPLVEVAFDFIVRQQGLTVRD
jgi:acetyl esterase/lipase